jgi:hypothetical protein
VDGIRRPAGSAETRREVGLAVDEVNPGSPDEEFTPRIIEVIGVAVLMNRALARSLPAWRGRIEAEGGADHRHSVGASRLSSSNQLRTTLISFALPHSSSGLIITKLLPSGAMSKFGLHM